ncbi:hypothetical protein EVAR_90287_1 [Eumeta japonica]|uniref:Uncharacterized protein n=1 Tax=Eumeta variegata TaxID=151549 RepID=A0A4C1Z738_EUMVA|nr:hypothetical protein EVAR_90287_1 [Eumeta japonica]
MDTRNSRGVVSALPASWVGKGYMAVVEWADGRRMGQTGQCGTGSPTHATNQTAEADISRLYSVRVWYFTGQNGLLVDFFRNITFVFGLMAELCRNFVILYSLWPKRFRKWHWFKSLYFGCPMAFFRPVAYSTTARLYRNND